MRLDIPDCLVKVMKPYYDSLGNVSSSAAIVCHLGMATRVRRVEDFYKTVSRIEEYKRKFEALPDWRHYGFYEELYNQVTDLVGNELGPRNYSVEPRTLEIRKIVAHEVRQSETFYTDDENSFDPQNGKQMLVEELMVMSAERMIHESANFDIIAGTAEYVKLALIPTFINSRCNPLIRRYLLHNVELLKIDAKTAKMIYDIGLMVASRFTDFDQIGESLSSLNYPFIDDSIIELINRVDDSRFAELRQLYAYEEIISVKNDQGLPVIIFQNGRFFTINEDYSVGDVGCVYILELGNPIKFMGIHNGVRQHVSIREQCTLGLSLDIEEGQIEIKTGVDREINVDPSVISVIVFKLSQWNDFRSLPSQFGGTFSVEFGSTIRLRYQGPYDKIRPTLHNYRPPPNTPSERLSDLADLVIDGQIYERIVRSFAESVLYDRECQA